MSRRALCCLIVVTAANVAGCQIFGLVAAPCSNDNSIQECDDGQVCVDGTCAPIPVVSPACTDAPAAPAPEARSAEWEVTAKRGASATGSKLLGLDELIVLDLACAPTCSSLDRPVARARAPLPGDVAAASVVNGPFRAANVQLRTDEPFAFELVYRAPTLGDGVIASVSAGAGSGWRIEAAGGDTSLFVGDTEMLLTSFGEAVWTHLLCFVDPALLVDGEPAGVLCSVDGNLPLLPPTTVGAWAPALDQPLTLGGPSGDAAVAFVRLWSGRPPELPASAAEAQSKLLIEGRTRLLRFLGIEVRTTGTLLFTNIDVFPRVMELPATPFQDRSLTLVGGSWPRLATNDVGTGLFFEATAKSLVRLDPAACAGLEVGPLGKADACRLGEEPLRLDADVADEERTFSVFFNAASTLEVTLTSANDANTTTCTVGGVGQTCRGNGTSLVPFSIEEFGAWRRFVITQDFPFALVTLEGNTLVGDDVIWAPQLERGPRPTSPIPFFLSSFGIFTNARATDALGIDKVGLGLTSEFTLEAEILDANDVTVPVIVLDDEEFDDGIVELQADFSLEPPTASIVGRVAQEDVEPDPNFITLPARVVGHVGRAVEPCADCVTVGPVRAAPLQAEVVLFLGPSAIVRSAGVHAFGSSAAPTALQVSVETPPRVPCLDGSEPLFVFSACAKNDGPCLPPDVPTLWDGAAQETGSATASAFPGELAVSGAFTTDLLGARGLGDLYVEARFKTPLRGLGGEAIQVRDEGGVVAAIGLEANQEGTSYTVVVSAGDVNRTLPVVGVAEWNQVACLFGETTRCILNLDDPIAFADLPAVRSQRLVSARVASAGDGALASARAWVVTPPENESAAASFLSTRALASFGIHVADRRAPIVASERRSTPSFTTVRLPGEPLSLERIGAHWPRVENLRGTLEYVVEPGGFDLLRDDFGDSNVVRVQQPGPHPALSSVRVEDGVELELSTELARSAPAEPGIVSVFLRDLDATASAELVGTNGSVTLPAGSVVGTAGVDDYGAWRRLWVQVNAGQRATLRVSGSAFLSAPQFDPRAAAPSVPALDDRHADDLLAIETADLGSSFAGVLELSLDPANSSGRLVGLQSTYFDQATGRGTIELWTLASDGRSLTIARDSRVSSQLSLINVAEDEIQGIGPVGDIAYWWHGRGAVVRKDDGELRYGSSEPPADAPELLFLGSTRSGPVEKDRGARMRLRSITIRRGDL